MAQHQFFLMICGNGASRRSFDLLSSRQIGARQRTWRAQNFRESSLKHNFPARFSVPRPQLDDLVRRAHNAGVMFDNHDRVARVPQLAEQAHEPVRVARVQANTRLVQDKQSVDKAGAKTCGKVDPFGFSAGERAGWALQTQIP